MSCGYLKETFLAIEIIVSALDLGFFLEDSNALMYSEHPDRVVSVTPLVVLLLTMEMAMTISDGIKKIPLAPAALDGHTHCYS